jgi:TIR domain/VHL beta domain
MARGARVFISYSRESQEHGERVLSLAMRLREEGVDASMDRLAPQNPEGGWQHWMEEQIRLADFVLVVCTEEYLKRVERPFEQQGGAGVFWEVSLIRSYIYDSKGRDTRFIPIFFGADDEKRIPRALLGSRYRVDTQSGYVSLYRLLTDQPEVSPGDLGPIKVLPPVTRKPLEFAPEASAAPRSGTTEPPRNEARHGRSEMPQAPPERERLDEESEFVQLEALPCDERQLRSQHGQSPTLIRFDNYLDEHVFVYWLDYEGRSVLYAKLGPGETYQQRTYVTHPWVVARMNAASHAECLAIFQPVAEPGIAAINRDLVPRPQ